MKTVRDVEIKLPYGYVNKLAAMLINKRTGKKGVTSEAARRRLRHHDPVALHIVAEMIDKDEKKLAASLQRVLKPKRVNLNKLLKIVS